MERQEGGQEEKGEANFPRVGTLGTVVVFTNRPARLRHVSLFAGREAESC